MSEFDPNAAAASVLGDSITPEFLAGLKNPSMIDPGPYVMVITGFKEFPPKEVGKKGMIAYDVEVVRSEGVSARTRWPRQSLRFWSTVGVEDPETGGMKTDYNHTEECSKLWIRLLPNALESVKPGMSAADFLAQVELIRQGLTGIPFRAMVTHKENSTTGELQQRINVLKPVVD